MAGTVEIPQRVDPVPAMSCVDVERCPSATPGDPVSKVLDDDNLLREIIVRLGFPTILVRAALICKRWLHHASDPTFLRRFRKLHPPCILGFYFESKFKANKTCVPMSPPQELDTVIRHAGFSLDYFFNQTLRTHIVDCWDGNVFLRLDMYKCGTGSTWAVHRPLCAQRGIIIIPPFPWYIKNMPNVTELIFGEGDGLSYLRMDSTKERATVEIYMLQDGVWSMHTSTTTELHGLPLNKKLTLVENQVYMCVTSYILVFDLTDLSFSKIQYPQVVGFTNVVMLSHDDDDDDNDSGLYLVHVKELQLGIWLHKEGRWLMVGNICLREMYANLKMLDSTLVDEHTAVVRISQVGPNSEFVFLQVKRSILYLDIKCKTLCKVYEITREDQCFGHYIHPFMMIWPPKFPALKG